MSEKYEVQPGAVIGRWTVLEECAGAEPRTWKCRCSCGTEREVSDRGLRYGASKSCGCLRAERALKKNAHELTGMHFGRLSVIGQAEAPEHRAGRWWNCRCDCGNEIAVSGTRLVTGKKTSCGCAAERKYAYTDIAGQRFHRLTALRPLDGRTEKGGMIWQCRCDCGTELAVSYNELVYSNIKSCGCRKREHDRMLKDLMAHVDGTSISHLRSRKTPSNNTTGVRGVYLIKGKYVAKIGFQKKQYLLGSFDNLAEAAQARQRAEQEINGRVTAYYDRWKSMADSDPGWAEDHPIRICVERGSGGLQVRITPGI